MSNKFVTAVFGDYSKKEVKKLRKTVSKILDLESKYQEMDDKELASQTNLLKERLANGETLDDILPDAFAVCREAGDRVLGMKHFEVQLIGGIVLHQGRIAEMKTGEGKTLVATLPAYLNALAGKGVHIVTVNDYLAKRDSEWMGKLYRFLGLSVGLIIHEKTDAERREAYACDITYGTNNEMGFDYLRDNMVQYKEQKVQRGHSFAVVDEVDSILIDEARTPLIISGQGAKSDKYYGEADKFVRTLSCVKVAKTDDKKDAEEEYDADYIVDEKAKTATLLKSGVEKAEAYFKIDDLTSDDYITIRHHIDQAIKAHGVMTRDIDYVVKDGQVKIVDEFTGRIMEGRRYNEGLHQALEAKEGVKVEHESKTLATITFQNYFRLYKKLSGMTGTASTEAQEFDEIYKLDVVEIPTNMPLIRDDRPDKIFATIDGKYKNIVEQIKECHDKGQPILVGTVSIEKSEYLSKLLKKAGIEHNVLNAKNHEKEAQIVAQAGKFGAVTIATNMAGRGTDIMLGGNAEYLAKAKMKKLEYSNELIEEATGFAETDDEEILEARATFLRLQDEFKEEIKVEADKVREAGGLFILGTERHDARRIDNQLRGRSGRQGDPGVSQFLLSTEDDLMRLFGGDKIGKVLSRVNQEDDAPLESRLFSKTLESAQQKVEGKNFAIRKNTVQYDDVMNRQRELIYAQRDQVLEGIDVSDTIDKMVDSTIKEAVDFFLVGERKDWNVEGLIDKFTKWNFVTAKDFADVEEMSAADICDLLLKKAHEYREAQLDRLGVELYQAAGRKILLQCVDTFWMEHIDTMEDLKTGIHLRSYAQKDPVVAYRTESYDLFEAMTANIREATAYNTFTATINHVADTVREAGFHITSTTSGDIGGENAKQVTVRKDDKVGPNEPCPCGSGLKYKKCCGSPAKKAADAKAAEEQRREENKRIKPKRK